MSSAFRTLHGDPDLADQVKSNVLMGGVLDVAGNVFEDASESPTPDWK